MNRQHYDTLSKEIFVEVVPTAAHGLTYQQAVELVSAYAEAMHCIHRRAGEREDLLRKRLGKLGVSADGQTLSS